MSRISEISIQCYLRTETPKRGPDGDDMGNDLFIGGVKFMPDFDSLKPSNEWRLLAGGTGKIQIGVSYAPNLVCLFSSTPSGDLLMDLFELGRKSYH